MLLPILSTNPSSQYLKTECNKSLLKSHMETYYYRSSYRQIDIGSLNVVTINYGKRMPQLDTIYYQLESLLPDIGFFFVFLVFSSLAKWFPQTLYPC